jgi:hypothetical protein
MEASSLGSGLGFLHFLVGERKIGFEGGPGFLGGWASSPISASVDEEACLEDGVVGESDDLGSIVGGIGCGVKFNGVVKLIEDKFDRLGRIVGRFHASVIVNDNGGRDVAVAMVEMAENGKCSHVRV